MKHRLNAGIALAVGSCFLFGSLLLAQSDSGTPAARPDDYSGMYTFLRDGEFVQISPESDGTVTGFVSRFGDGESDRGAFLDHFFKTGRLENRKLTFITRTVHGVWYQFTGTIGRGDGKDPGEVGYYVVKGTLIESSMDSRGRTMAKTLPVVLKSFPRDMNSDSTSTDPNN